MRVVYLSAVLLLVVSNSSSWVSVAALRLATHHVSSQYKQRLVSRRFVVEHLIDCAQDPIFADLYGAGSEMCIQRGPHFFQDVGAFLGQISTIAFFALSTIALQRGFLNGIDSATDSTVAEDDTQDRLERGGVAYKRCPQW
jgi:hypothetical protein